MEEEGGVGPAVPVIISVHKSKRLKVVVKYIVIVLAVFLFMGGIFMITRTSHSQYEEFQRRQQEWESMKLRTIQNRALHFCGARFCKRNIIKKD